MRLNTLTLDVETTVKNKGHCFTPENFLVCYSLKWNEHPTTFHYYTDLDFRNCLRAAFDRADVLVGFNIKFDLHWVYRLLGGLDFRGCIFDCSLAEFIVTGQEAAYASLNDSLISYGLPTKKDEVKAYWDAGVSTEDIPRAILEEYNVWDVETTYMLYQAQQKVLSDKQKALVLLEGEDMKTLIEAEQNGMKWNREQALKALAEYKDKVNAIQETLWSYVPDEAKKWFNWDSGDDLSALLYGGTRVYPYCTEEDAIYKSGDKKGQSYIKRSWFEATIPFPQRFNPLKNTLVKKCLKPDYKGTLYYQVDEPTLKQLKSKRAEDRKLLQLLQDAAKTGKVVEMLEELFKISTELGWQNDLLHGQFNQNVVRTGRLSSSRPNMQNKPPELDMFLVSRYG